MAKFTKTKEYYERTIQNLKNAIEGTKRSKENLTEQRAIEAHEAYIDSCERKLKKVREEFVQSFEPVYYDQLEN